MNIEKQVCSLELAKQLEELGVKQKSVWYWFKGRVEWHSRLNGRTMNSNTYPISAFTVAELINELRTVAKQDIIVAKDDSHPANTLAQQLIQYEKSKVQR